MFGNSQTNTTSNSLPAFQFGNSLPKQNPFFGSNNISALTNTSQSCAVPVTNISNTNDIIMKDGVEWVKNPIYTDENGRSGYNASCNNTAIGEIYVWIDNKLEKVLSTGYFLHPEDIKPRVKRENPKIENKNQNQYG